MKQFINFIIFLVAFNGYTQTNTKNYIKETIRRSPSSGTIGFQFPTNANFVTTTYFDGLGRSIQIVDQNSSPDDNKNIVTHIEYDKNIGQTKEYLPFLSPGAITSTSDRLTITTYNSNFVENGREETLNFYFTEKYEHTSNPYNEKIIEASPRNRVLEIGYPGQSWAASLPATLENFGYSNADWEVENPKELRHTVRNEYGFNLVGEVNRFSVTTTYADGLYKNSISSNSTYPPNTLTKTIIKNENWQQGDGNNNTIVEFKDSKGNIVLKRMFNNNERHDTYYVYNNLDLLAFVIPPMTDGTIDSSKLNLWCYQYNYDAKNRLVEKKLPQKDWEYIIYDKMDRQVMSGPVYSPFGDGTKGWFITKYDVLGRVAYTGFYGATSFTSATRNSLSQNIFTLESRSTNTTVDGITIQYTNTSFPTTFKLLSINYYDNYNYPSAPTSFPQIEGITPNTNVKGQLTGLWARTLTNSSSVSGTLSYNLYDDKYRVIREYTTNHLGGYTQADSKLSFTGVPTKTVTTQKHNSSASLLVITDEFSYDRRDRLVSQTQKINNGTPENIFVNEYDELGVLITKKVGVATSNQLQKIDYKYNIRGWLTDINNADSNLSNSEDNDLFQLKINYNTSGIINDNLYNGNINSVWTRTKKDNIFKGYTYWYDDLNRLTDAKNMTYHKPSGWLMGQRVDDSYREQVSYDKNGNIKTLLRTGEMINSEEALEIDNLTYTYTGNQLQSVFDATNNSDGFKDENLVGVDYTYDTFGNLLQDKNKSITNIKYNHLNLPTEVVFNSGKINYTYDAFGNKLSKKVQPTGGTIETTDYINAFQYVNNVLKFFPHPEGYVEVKNNNYLYTYQYKDHLGNVRLTYRDGFKNHTTQENVKDGIIQVSEIIDEKNYYPYGMIRKGDNDFSNYNSINKYNYAYGGKELNSELGLEFYDFGARNYDPALGRWMNVDPLAENSRRWTPYNYAYNNPIFFVDPDGMQSRPTDSYGRDLLDAGVAFNYWFFGDSKRTEDGSEQNIEGYAKNLVNMAVNSLPKNLKKDAINLMNNLKKNVSNFEYSRLALGKETYFGGETVAGIKSEISFMLGQVMFFNGEDAGYAYSYYGGDAGIGGETSVSAAVNLGSSVYVGYNTGSMLRKDFIGEYQYYRGGIGVSTGTVLGGLDISASINGTYAKSADWGLYYAGASMGGGYGVSTLVTGSVTYGKGVTSYIPGQKPGKPKTMQQKMMSWTKFIF